MLLLINALAMSVMEWTREIGLLRAVGLGRAPPRRMVRLEAVVISVYDAAMGLVLGTVFGVALSRALADRASRSSPCRSRGWPCSSWWRA